MTRAARKTKALERIDRLADSGTPETAGGGVVLGSDRTADPATPALQAACLDAIRDLLRRDDGWLRAIPSRDGGKAYFKWKFNRGRWAGYYVMSVVDEYYELSGLVVLADKVSQVDVGIRKPSLDTAYEAE